MPDQSPHLADATNNMTILFPETQVSLGRSPDTTVQSRGSFVPESSTYKRWLLGTHARTGSRTRPGTPIVEQDS